jgi:uncharacterized protein YegP (UPF0339 family)
MPKKVSRAAALTTDGITVYRDINGHWRWRWVRGGNIIAGALEGYTDKSWALRMARYVRGGRPWVRIREE